MNTPTASEAIDPKLVAEVVRVMRKERLRNAAAATNLFICSQDSRFFGNATHLAAAAQELYTKEDSIRYRSQPRPWTHASATHDALAAKEAAA